MTGSDQNPRTPGGLLLKVARLIFDEATLSAVVLPALADLDHEVREAGPRGTARMNAICRGLWAFTKLIVVAPLAVSASPVTGQRGLSPSNSPHDRFLLLLPLLFIAAAWVAPFFRAFITMAFVSGVFFAVAIRWWNRRHPLHIAERSPRWQRAEINFSSIPVGADAGGLICTVGAAVILVSGVPAFVWFLMATLFAGVLLAASLAVWHTLGRSTGLSRSLLGRA